MVIQPGTGDAPTTSIMSKLAWRAKWRNRWKKWKTVIFLMAILAVVLFIVLLFALPGHIYDYIDENKFGETKGTANEVVQPWAAENWYKLTRLLEISMREKEAMARYKTMEKWHYGYDLKAWCLRGYKRPRRKQRIPKLKIHKDARFWVGYAIFRRIQYLRTKSKKEWAYHMAKDRYLPFVKKYPRGRDAVFTRQLETFVLMYTIGG